MITTLIRKQKKQKKMKNQLVVVVIRYLRKKQWKEKMHLKHQARKDKDMSAVYIGFRCVKNLN